jgi:hypothetical protein
VGLFVKAFDASDVECEDFHHDEGRGDFKRVYLSWRTVAFVPLPFYLFMRGW